MGTSTRIQVGILVLMALLFLELAPQLHAQLSAGEDERLKLLTDSDSTSKKAEKDKTRPPIEFYRSQIAPFDVLPYVKPNHWSSFILDMKMNEADFDGLLQTEPLRLLGMPQQMVYGREARLVREQRSSLSFQILGSVIPKEMQVSLIKPGAIRADGAWQAGLMTLPTAQMLVMILSKESSPRFSAWSRFSSTLPSRVSLEDIQAIELARYYRMVIPTEPDKVYLSPHPLTWSTLSHVVWDDVPPDALSVSQQRALLDWIHWGGQLILCGGANANATLFRESFLAPYLPGDRTGETKALTPDDLKILSEAYPPSTQVSRGTTTATGELEPLPTNAIDANKALRQRGFRYQPPQPLLTGASEPVYFADIRAKATSSKIPLGGSSPLLLGVESRVGRGRITMLTFNPNEASLLTWPGLDTLVRRVILRRPEEVLARAASFDGTEVQTFQAHALPAPDLSWYRLAARDGLGVPAPEDSDGEKDSRKSVPGVADWFDGAIIPRLARDILEEASGISIPSSSFVLKVILTYIVALVPLNWLFCRFVLRRREWSWLIIPALSLAFAVGVERMAAFDVGFESSCDEVDVLEFQGSYGRAHLSRFAALFTTGRGDFTLTFPNDPTALALPFDNGRSIGGEDIATSNLQTYPSPMLSNIAVQPRSLSMIRAEQMLNLAGGFELHNEGSTRMLSNRTELELRDTVLVTFDENFKRFEHFIGDLTPGSSVEVKEPDGQNLSDQVSGFQGPDPSSVLNELRRARELRPENAGEVRLVGWTSKPVSGMKIEPDVDRFRGVTVVVAHLGFGPSPNPGSARYNILANGPEKPSFTIRDSDFDIPQSSPTNPRATFPRRR